MNAAPLAQHRPQLLTAPQFDRRLWLNHSNLFGRNTRTISSRAPGRLDFLGGVSDYSGGTVLERTIAHCAWIAVQTRPDSEFRLRSTASPEDISVSRTVLFDGAQLRSAAEVSAALRGTAGGGWAAYVLGCVYMLVEQGHLDAQSVTGLNVLIDSEIPSGAGVSSSAALEMATVTALCTLWNCPLNPLVMAQIGQMAENRIAQAPCGIMDQVTCAMGTEGALLALQCRPHTVEGNIALPAGWSVLGLDSGVKHSVGGSAYTDARTAAFMGLRILRTALPNLAYISDLSPAEWRAHMDMVPQQLGGDEFLRAYCSHLDTATSVEPDRTYNVRASTEHPVMELQRVNAMRKLLQGGDTGTSALHEAGRLLLEAHEAYNTHLQMGSRETDLLVQLAMDKGPGAGIYGAKITGGGSGGTVAVLLSGDQAISAIEEVRVEYKERTGYAPTMMVGSVSGSAVHGAWDAVV